MRKLETLSIGHHAIAVASLLIIGGFIIATFVAELIRRRRGIDIETPLWLSALVGSLVARIAFVAQHWSLYLAAPASMLQIGDGGFRADVGITAALVTALLLLRGKAHTGRAFALACGSGVAAWAAGTAVLAALAPTPMSLPATALNGLDGHTLTLAAFKGKPVVVNLWATWCPPCRREMPLLRDAQAQRPDIVFAFIDQGEDADTVRHYLADQGLALRNVALDPARAVAQVAGSQALPTTLFFHADGQLADQQIGGLNAATLAEHLNRLAPRATAAAQH